MIMGEGFQNPNSIDSRETTRKIYNSGCLEILKMVAQISTNMWVLQKNVGSIQCLSSASQKHSFICNPLIPSTHPDLSQHIRKKYGKCVVFFKQVKYHGWSEIILLPPLRPPLPDPPSCNYIQSRFAQLSAKYLEKSNKKYWFLTWLVAIFRKTYQ